MKDYDWTSVPRGSGMREKAPRVRIKSYKIKSSESINRIKSYLNIATASDPESFYNKLYGDAASPEDVFIIPFLGDNVRSFSNEYGDTFQSAFLGAADSMLMGGAKILGEIDTYNPLTNIAQAGKNYFNASREMGADLANVTNGSLTIKDIIGKAVDTMGKGYSTAPGSYIETPKLYQYAQNDSGLEVSFALSNTINSDYEKNTKLVEHLTKINRPERKSSTEMVPPRIYEVRLSGIRYIRWASCSNFSVTLLGTKRIIDGKIIPEGYMINMTFTSLTTEVSNFMDKINS